MLISYNWLKRYLPQLALDPSQLAELLTQRVFETVITSQINPDPKIIIAKVIKLKPHPQADRLRLATIFTGQAEITIVCGAPNIQIGDVVPFSPIGTCLTNQDGHTTTLKEATIRGIVSPGMLNSPRELGLGNWHNGIYVLPSDIPIGSRLIDHLPPDTVLDADITPNRAHDCLGHLGIAREIAALATTPLLEPSLELPDLSADPALQLSVEAPDQVARYFGIHLSNVAVEPSPLWMQSLLWSVGLRPINSIVDITNFVMMETGNPTHAFDLKQLPSQSIGVRLARSDEAVQLLDEQSLNLTVDDIVITAANQPIALAGIMGGLDSQVSDQTCDVLVEAAHFASFSIQETSRRHRLLTESALRFSKDLPVSFAAAAAARSLELFQEITGATVVGGISHQSKHSVSRSTITLRPNAAAKLAGYPITKQQVRDTLGKIRCTVEESATNWRVMPPVDRLDLIGEHDLIEEVTRFVGLEKISPISPTIPTHPTPLSDHVLWRELIRDFWVSLGFTESYNYSFGDEAINQRLGFPATSSQAIALVNPPAGEQKYLRSALAPLLISQAISNREQLCLHQNQIENGLFEVSTVFQSGSDNDRVAGVTEEEHLCVVTLVSLSDLLAFLEQFGERIGLKLDEPIPEQVPQAPAQCRTLGIHHGQKLLGYVAVANADSFITKKMRAPVIYCEINLDQLLTQATVRPDYELITSAEVTQYISPSKYPPVYRDISLLVVSTTTPTQVEEVISQTGGILVVDINLFDEYQPRDQKTKGLAFHVTYQATDHTLSNDEVNQLHHTILEAIQRDFNATLRE